MKAMWGPGATQVLSLTQHKATEFFDAVPLLRPEPIWHVLSHLGAQFAMEQNGRSALTWSPCGRVARSIL